MRIISEEVKKDCMLANERNLERICEILESTMPQVDFEHEVSLVDDGILDSLDIASLVSELNTEFDIDIPSEEITSDNLNSVKAINDLVERFIYEE
jgi:acyl carrier protein